MHTATVYIFICVMQFVTEGYTILCALRLSGCTGLDDVPRDLPNDKNQQLAWLRETSRKVVERCWLPYNSEALKLAAHVAEHRDAENGDDTDLYPFCHCKEGKSCM